MAMMVLVKRRKGIYFIGFALASCLLCIVNLNVSLTLQHQEERGNTVGVTFPHHYHGRRRHHYSSRSRKGGPQGQGNKEEIIIHPGDLIQEGVLECPSPLVPFYDVIPPPNKNDTPSSSPIPKTLFISMRSRCLPQDYYFILQRWQQILPNYAIRFYDDNDVNEFLFDENNWPEFPFLQKALKCIQFKGAMMVDIWRILVLYKYGGVYTDIDNWPLDPFSEGLWTLGRNNTNLTAFFFSDSNYRPSQWFMVMEPRHPIAYFAMLDIQENLLNLPNIGNPNIVQTTGPLAFKDAFYRFVFSDYDQMTQSSSSSLRGGEGYFTGMYQKRVRKLGTYSREEYITAKRGWDDIIVDSKRNNNMTRADRVKLENGGIDHWQKELNKKNKKGEASYDDTLYRGSCMNYLKSLEVTPDTTLRDANLSRTTERGPPKLSKEERDKKRKGRLKKKV